MHFLRGRLRLRKGTFRWILVLGVFFTQFFAVGFIVSYGVYAAAYCSTPPPVAGFDGQQRRCQLPGALAEFASTLFGLAAGRLAEHPRIGFRAAALAGAAAFGLAFLLAGSSPSFGFTVFAQGFLAGLGASFVVFATMGMIPRYFAMAGDYRSTAFGLAITGMGFGGFALAAATQAMIDAWGLPWALRVTGIVGGAVLSGASMLCVPAESWDEEGDAGPPCDPLSSAEAGPPVPDTGSTADTCGTLEEQVVAADPLNSTVTLHRATLPAASIETLPGLSSHYATLTRDQLKPASAPREHIPLRRLVFSTPFLLSCGFIFFLPFGSLGPATFGPSYARDVIGLDPTQAAHSVVVLNAGQILGSAASAAFAERIGGPATNVSFYVALSGLLMVAFWPFARTGALFLGYMALQGFANGAFNALVGNTVANNFDEASAAGAMSMAISFAAYGSLAGPEIQGAIVDAAGYLGMMAFSGAVMLVAAGFAWALRMHMSGGKWLAKV